MRFKRGSLTTKVKDAVFEVYGDSLLTKIDSNAIPKKIEDWKKSKKTKDAYRKIFSPIVANNPDNTYISQILQKVFPKGEQKTVVLAFAIGVAQALLSPGYEKITIEKKIMKERIEKNKVEILYLSFIVVEKFRIFFTK